jgi:hypothetical protein
MSNQSMSNQSMSNQSSAATASSAPSISSSSIVIQSSSFASSAPPATGDFDFTLGKTLYTEHCVECHGVTGGGGTGAISAKFSDTSFAAIMVRVDGGNMPSFKGPLSGREYVPEQCIGGCAYQIAGYISSGFPGADEVVNNAELGFEGCSTPERAPAARALRQLTRREFQNSVNDIFNVNLDLTANFPPEGRSHGFTNNADIAQVTALHLDVYFSAASRVAAEVKANFDNTVRPELGCNSNEQCLEDFVRRYGRKIFRRPLTETEFQDYFPFFREGITDFNHSERFKDALTQGISSLLMSSNFLYRSELGTKVAGQDFYQLSQYEIATLLAFTYTGSTPSNDLLAKAEAGELNSKAALKAVAEQLLATERGKDQMAYFAVEWWDAGLELIGSKNLDFYQGYTPAVIQSMVGEMEEFFKYVTFESTGKFQELYSPGYTLLNDTLSNFYGIGSGLTSTFQPVTTSQRGGILSMGGIMAQNASTEESSPVKRGVFVREQLMCDPLPPLPRDVNIPNPDLDPTKPVRERFVAHSINPNCWACHKFFDDIGFSLEIFDASGKYREAEKLYNLDTLQLVNEFDIDTAGKIISVDGDEEFFFSDANELAAIFANADSTKSCMTTQYYRYVVGYNIADADQCAIENLNKIFADNEFDIQSLLLGITQLDSFTLRK